jgi:hypothetical protein
MDDNPDFETVDGWSTGGEVAGLPDAAPWPCLPIEEGKTYEASASIRGGRLSVVLSGAGMPDLHLNETSFMAPPGYTSCRLVVTSAG